MKDILSIFAIVIGLLLFGLAYSKHAHGQVAPCVYPRVCAL